MNKSLKSFITKHNKAIGLTPSHKAPIKTGKLTPKAPDANNQVKYSPKTTPITGKVMTKKKMAMKTKKKVLTSADRKQLNPSSFVFPKTKKYPIPDANHARNALARVSANGNPAEKAKVRAVVSRKFPAIK